LVGAVLNFQKWFLTVNNIHQLGFQEPECLDFKFQRDEFVLQSLRSHLRKPLMSDEELYQLSQRHEPTVVKVPSTAVSGTPLGTQTDAPIDISTSSDSIDSLSSSSSSSLSCDSSATNASVSNNAAHPLHDRFQRKITDQRLHVQNLESQSTEVRRNTKRRRELLAQIATAKEYLAALESDFAHVQQ
jgi:hypothetical protein